MRSARALFLIVLIAGAAQNALAQAPVAYRLTFPEPEHHVMQVEVTLGKRPSA